MKTVDILEGSETEKLEAENFERYTELYNAPETEQQDESLPLTPGTVMKDGSIYGGLSPETGTALYIYPEKSEKILSLGQAFHFAKTMNKKNPGLGSRWRMPTRDEWKTLYGNRNEGALITIFNDSMQSQDRFWTWPQSEDEIIIRSGVWSPTFERASSGSDPGWHHAGYASAFVVRTSP